MLETEYLPYLLIHGISYDSFWNLTLREMNNIAKTIESDRETDYYIKSQLAYTSAIMNAEAYFGKIRSHSSYFPELSNSNISEEDKLKMRMMNLATKKG